MVENRVNGSKTLDTPIKQNVCQNVDRRILSADEVAVELIRASTRWTELTDLDAEAYRAKYGCKGWACAVDCFNQDLRAVLAKARDAGLLPTSTNPPQA